MSRNNENDPTPNKRPNIENHDSQLVRMFCIDLRPSDILEDNGFQEFIKNTSNYTLPTMSKFSEKLNEQYDTAKSNHMNTLESIHHVTVTMDSWKWKVSRSNKGRSMLSISIHFVHQGKLVSRNLFTIDASRRKDESVASIIRDKLTKWGVFNKVVCFVNNDDEDISLRKSCTLWNKLHVICLTATLNTVIQGGLKLLKIDELQVMYQKDISEKTLKTKHGSQTDKRFSWHNEYTVLKELCENNACEDAAKRRELNECFQILKSFEDLNNTLSSQQFITLSYIIPLFVGLKMRISECSPSTTMAIEFKKTMENLIGGLYEDYRNEPIAVKATFMDPRFKTAVLDQAEKAESLQKDVIQELNDGVDFCNPQEPVPTTSKNGTEGSGNLLSYLADQRHDRNANSSRAQAAVAHYVQMPDKEKDEDPFIFWNLTYESSRYKEFYIMSQKYLCIPATAMPVESISGESPWKKIVPNYINFNERRNSLEYENIDKILFLHSYYSINTNT